LQKKEGNRVYAYLQNKYDELVFLLFGKIKDADFINLQKKEGNRVSAYLQKNAAAL
jgi:hypothetical protein